MKFPKIDLCCGRDELRPSLNYVCVKRNYTYASDGHILVRHKTDEIFEEDFYTDLPDEGVMIHRNAFAIMRQVKTTRISLSIDKKTILLHRSDESVISYNCQPDVNSPVSGYPLPDTLKCKPLTDIAINARLLSRLAESMGATMCILRLYFYSQTKNILCDPNKQGDYYSAIGIIMPVMIN